MNNETLAILIPYFKIDYLDDLLLALRQQDDQYFSVYIGDDCSPSSPLDVISRHQEHLDITYVRYEERIGDKCLASHWNRCLKITKCEKWVWVIPDDDLPSRGCISSFRRAVVHGKPDQWTVAVFPAGVIDAHGNICAQAIYRGDNTVDDSYDHYMRQLSGNAQGSSLGENVFNYEALISVGGFVPFPKAWGSDHATIYLVASKGGRRIRWISDATFYFRMSSLNISSRLDDGHIKMNAKIQFFRWLTNNGFMLYGDRDMSLMAKYIYFKGEHYFLYVWVFSMKTLFFLFRLRRLCVGGESRSKTVMACAYLSCKRILRSSHWLAGLS